MGLELAKKLLILVLQGNHRVMLTWTAQKLNELENPAPKNVVVTDGCILSLFGTLVSSFCNMSLVWHIVSDCRKWTKAMEYRQCRYTCHRWWKIQKSKSYVSRGICEYLSFKQLLAYFCLRLNEHDIVMLIYWKAGHKNI